MLFPFITTHHALLKGKLWRHLSALLVQNGTSMNTFGAVMHKAVNVDDAKMLPLLWLLLFLKYLIVRDIGLYAITVGFL